MAFIAEVSTLIASVNGSIIPKEITEYLNTSKAAANEVERLNLECSPNPLQSKVTEGNGIEYSMQTEAFGAF